MNAPDARKREKAQERLGAAEAFILDLDGTIYLSDTLIPGAAEFIRHLRDAGKRYVFITNNSSRTAAEYVEKLARLGLPCTGENVYTSLDATLSWLSGRDGRRVFPLGTPSLVERVREAGYQLEEDEPDWVLLGFDTTLTYEKIRKAARALRHGARFVATHPDLTCPTADGPVPDAGSFIKMFEAATKRSPVVCGKPHPPMVEGALERLGAPPEHSSVVGDRLYTDMAMGRAAGLLAVLVLSGETDRAGLEAAPEEHRPDLVFENVGEILAAMEAAAR